ncbi:hypothetical protein Trydic_g18572 [Trypoxylus dichotomus]
MPSRNLNPQQVLNAIDKYLTNILFNKMNYSTIIIATFGIVSIFLINSSSSTTIPMINCEPNSLSEAPAKIRQLCYYVMEQLRSEQPQDNGEMIDSKLYERGIKRQDVDHVFLRFGRRFGF